MTEVSDLKTLSARTLNVLARNGIHSIEEIRTHYPNRLLRLTGFGMHALREVEAALFPGAKYDLRSEKSKRQPSVELLHYLHSMLPPHSKK